MKILQVSEIRQAYFLQAFDRPVEEMLIISMGGCNYNCPYCKRDGQFKGCGNDILTAYDMPLDEIYKIIDRHVALGRRIRLSGGEPCIFPSESLSIAKYCMDKHGVKISVAHNGSSPSFIRTLIPYLDYVALDFKGATPEKIAHISNTPVVWGSVAKIKDILDICSGANVLVDVRTVIFGGTSLEDLKIIGNILSKYSNVFWTLRKYNTVEGCDFLPTTVNIKKIADLFHSIYHIPVGYRDKWEACDFYIAKSHVKKLLDTLCPNSLISGKLFVAKFFSHE